MVITTVVLSAITRTLLGSPTSATMSGVSGSAPISSRTSASFSRFLPARQTVARHLGREPWLMPVHFALWHTVASIAEYVPGALLTHDQIALMQNDNVAAAQFPVSSGTRNRSDGYRCDITGNRAWAAAPDQLRLADREDAGFMISENARKVCSQLIIHGYDESPGLTIDELHRAYLPELDSDALMLAIEELQSSHAVVTFADKSGMSIRPTKRLRKVFEEGR